MKFDKDKYLKIWQYLWEEWVKPIIIAAILALFIRTFVIQPFKIPTTSMYPTLRPKDRIFVNKFIYGAKIPFINLRLPKVREPEIGDIIVFTSTIEKKKYLVKRLIGKSGDIVEIKNGKIFINGNIVKNKKINKFFYYNRGEYGLENKQIKVPENHFYVLGDNSSNSMDSRYWGFVPKSKLVGKAFLIHWPLQRIQLLKNEE